MTSMRPEPRTHCSGCGALVSEDPGPTHRYVVAAPGCWALFGEILAREYGELSYPAVHRLTVDSYMVQHPENAEHDRRQRQSIAFHLCRLFLDRTGTTSPEILQAQLRPLLRDTIDWPRLIPPVTLGWITVADVVGASDPEAHSSRVREWAASAWEGWHDHHETIRRLLTQ